MLASNIEDLSFALPSSLRSNCQELPEIIGFLKTMFEVTSNETCIYVSYKEYVSPYHMTRVWLEIMKFVSDLF